MITISLKNYKSCNMVRSKPLRSANKYSFRNSDADIFQKTSNLSFLVVKAAETYLKNKYDIVPDFGTDQNIRLANLIVESLDEIDKKGLRLEKGTKFVIGNHILNYLVGNGLAFNLALSKISKRFKDGIYIIPAALDDFKEQVAKNPNFYSTKNIKHIIFHELAHKLHYQNAPEKIANLPKYLGSSKEDFPNYKDRYAFIDREVSRYANGLGIIDGIINKDQMANPNLCEFVAEVFAGLMDGKTYSDKIMRLYSNLGGPLLNES